MSLLMKIAMGLIEKDMKASHLVDLRGGEMEASLPMLWPGNLGLLQLLAASRASPARALFPESLPHTFRKRFAFPLESAQRFLRSLDDGLCLLPALVARCRLQQLALPVCAGSPVSWLAVLDMRNTLWLGSWLCW